jgi:hypothetical protein
MVNWRRSRLAEPVTIHDLNGEPLFYDFTVTSLEGEPMGLVRASANRSLAEPVTSVYLGGPRWDLGTALLRAGEIVERKLRGKVISTKVVCYAYPKLGIAVEWTTPRRPEPERTIFDVSDLSIVPEQVEPDMRGPGAWSVYDRMSGRTVPRAVKRFDSFQKVVSRIRRAVRSDLVATLSSDKFEMVQDGLGKIIVSAFARRLTLCTHSYSHECFRLHAQSNGVWCVVATGQMILDFWRYYHTQAGIANAMGTGAGGTGWNGEVNGLESLTCSHFDAQTDFNPTFAKVKAEINANRPFDYSYSYHAMACAGYSSVGFPYPGMQPSSSVYLYDPWPVNTGTIRWETWGSGVSSVAGFVYLRRS